MTSGTGSQSDLIFSMINTPDAMVLDASGNVGIGASSPGNQAGHHSLVVGSGTGHQGLTLYSGSDSVGEIGWNDADDSGQHALFRYDHNTDKMEFYTGGASMAHAMTIDGSQNVGIGTAAPTTALFVSNGLPSTTDDSASSCATFSGDGTHAYGYISQVSIQDNTPATSGNGYGQNFGGSISFGAVTKSTVTRGYQLVATISGKKETDTDGEHDGYLQFVTRKTTGGGGITEKMRITSAGNVGIGTTAPLTNLVVGEHTDGFGQINIVAGKVYADNASTTLTPKGNCYSILLLVADATTGYAAAFLSTYKGIMVEIADGDSYFVPTDTDNGGVAVYKSINTTDFTIKNYSNQSANIGVAMYALEAQ
jgi:hypothetical protein